MNAPARISEDARARRSAQPAAEERDAGGARRPVTRSGHVLEIQRAVGNQVTREILGAQGASAIQAKAAGPAAAGGGRGGGGNLTGIPSPVRSKMEAALGADFSGVRVHPRSSRAAALGALAYTQGSEIHVAPGQWAPETTRGQELLGHELAHVVQQREGRVKAAAQYKGVALNDDRALEAEADRAGARAARASIGGHPVRATPSSNGAPVVQRKALVNAAHMDPAGDWVSTVDGAGRVTKVVAKDLSLAPGQKFPGSGHNSPTPSGSPKSWKWLVANQLVHGSGPPGYVRMHLLNGRMGGPGKDAANLAPGTGSLNTNHSKNCEEEMIAWMNRGGEIDEYEVEVSYNRRSTSLKTASGQNAWMDTIEEIQAQFKYTDNTNTQHTEVFEAEEDTGLDRWPNWQGH